jgi:hypothetical protein
LPPSNYPETATIGPARFAVAAAVGDDRRDIKVLVTAGGRLGIAANVHAEAR